MEASKERARLIALGAIRPAAKEGVQGGSEKDTFYKGLAALIAAANRQIERPGRQRNWVKLKTGDVQYEHEAKRRWR